MKSITISADERLINAAEARARLERTTLDEQFRRWLASYAQQVDGAKDAMAVVADLQGKLRTGGRTFTRDERNAR
ncbi:MAG: hypothetical protein KF886_10700 [Candidatus Hydrogenedentes bacterium]|nr:hypothetical protein [Candidatus Hydrogenedentota bacterium]